MIGLLACVTISVLKSSKQFQCKLPICSYSRFWLFLLLYALIGRPHQHHQMDPKSFLVSRICEIIHHNSTKKLIPKEAIRSGVNLQAAKEQKLLNAMGHIYQPQKLHSDSDKKIKGGEFWKSTLTWITDMMIHKLYVLFICCLLLLLSFITRLIFTIPTQANPEKLKSVYFVFTFFPLFSFLFVFCVFYLSVVVWE